MAMMQEYYNFRKVYDTTEQDTLLISTPWYRKYENKKKHGYRNKRK